MFTRAFILKQSKGRGINVNSVEGGAFFLRGLSSDTSTLSLTKCTLRNNTASFDGGAIQSIFVTISATDSVFADNFASGLDGGDGGAVNMVLTRQSRFKNCRFDGNRAIDDGGAIHAQNSSFALEGCHFFNNNATDDGGSIKIVSRSSSAVKDCRFESNSVGDDGGAIYTFDAALSFTSCQFIGNRANVDGGAIHFSHDSNAAMEECLFESNYAQDDGGAISSRDTVFMKKCGFIRNAAGDVGGAILTRSTATLNAFECQFEENEALGGGAVWNPGPADFTDCQFEANTAISGAAIFSGYTNASETIISGSSTVFRCNVASYLGGAILHRAGKLSISEVGIIGNTAGSQGGGLWLGKETTSFIDNASFEQNSVLGDFGPFFPNQANGGGAITMAQFARSGGSGGTSTLTVNNTIFQGNSANTNGANSDDLFDYNSFFNTSFTNVFECGAEFQNCFCDADPTQESNITTNNLPTTCSGDGAGPMCSGCVSSIEPVLCSAPALAFSNNRASSRTRIDIPIGMDIWDMFEKADDDDDDDNDRQETERYEEKMKGLIMN